MSTLTDRRTGLSSSLAVKVPCRIATTANITLSGYQTIDGVLPTSSDTEAMRRVLVLNQTTAAQNGIYIMDTGTWSRAKDFDSSTDFVQGTRVYVHSGSTGVGWYVVTSTVTSTTVVGTDTITFTASLTYDTPINGFTTLSLADDAADYLQIYDTSAAQWKKVLQKNLAFTGSGTGATARSLSSKLGDFVSVKDFGAVGDGTTDDTAAIDAALTAASGAVLHFPPGTYKYVPSGSGFAPSASTKIYGYGATILKAGNGTLGALASAVEIEGLNFSGAGATYTGMGLVITAGNDQKLRDVDLVDFDSYCLAINKDVGIRFSWEGGTVYRHTNITDIPIKLAYNNAGVEESNGDRLFHGLFCAGRWLIDTDYAQTTIISNCDFINMNVGDHSSKTIIVGNRIATLGLDFHLAGTQGVFVGNIIAGNLVLDSSAQYWAWDPNTYPVGATVTDSSASPTTNGRGLLALGGMGAANTLLLSNGTSASFAKVPAAALAMTITPQGRLTNVTATPVLTSAQTAKTSIYYTPYVGSLIPCYTGSAWIVIDSAELSLALDSNSGHTGYHQNGKIFDVFVDYNSGTPRLVTGPAWSSDTARSAAIARLNGIWVNNASIVVKFDTTSSTATIAANKLTYVGSFRCSADGQVSWDIGSAASNGGAATLDIFSAYNRVPVSAKVVDTTASFVYATASYGALNGSNTNRISFLRGLDEGAVSAEVKALATGTSSAGRLGIGLDSTSSISGAFGYVPNGGTASLQGSYASVAPGLGYHYLQALQLADGGATVTYQGGTDRMHFVANLMM